MPERPFRVGVVGLGGVAEAHLEAYRSVTGLQVVAGADVDTGRLEKMSRRFHIRPYMSVEDMLENEKLDAACVLTPASTHRDVTDRCAAAGLHVLCEKPLAISLDDAQAMRAACRENDVRLFYGASYRFLPAITRARELVRSGMLGDIVLLSESSIGGRGLDRYRSLGPAHYPAGGPGGPGMGLVDHGIHLIDAFRWVTGSEIKSVVGRGIVSGESPVTEFLVMEFDNGATGHLVYNDFTFSTDLPAHGAFTRGDAWDSGGYKKRGSWLSHPGCIHIHGSRAALRVVHYANALYFIDADGVRQLNVMDRPAPAQFALQMEAFMECVQNNCEPAVTADDGIAALRVLRAAYASDTRGETVNPLEIEV